MSHDVLTLIPARLGSTRLPNKPLALIGGEPMIVQVWRRAMEAGLARVAVATDSHEVEDVCRQAGAEVVMTRADHPSGSDRIFEAAQALDPKGKHDVVLNVQGDLPTLAPELPAACLAALDGGADIGTLGTRITEEAEATNPNVVKIVGTPAGEGVLRALYFTRARAPHGDGPLYHHIGIYAYRRAALERFVSLPPSPLEEREKLEQLRALENGLRIDVALVDGVPLGVDTAEDLTRAQDIFDAKFD